MSETEVREVPSSLRRNAGFDTQQDLADAVDAITPAGTQGVSVRTIARAERGGMISGTKADLIATVLGITTAHYFAAIEYRRSQLKTSANADRTRNFRALTRRARSIR